MSEVTKAKLREVLLSIAASAGGDVSARTAQLRRALLEFGSDTADNLDAITRVEIGMFPSTAERKSEGMRLAATPVGLSNVLNAAEGCPLPPQLREEFPDLSQQDWDAVLRVACLVFLSLEARDAG
jgi:hypothetical protein